MSGTSPNPPVLSPLVLSNMALSRLGIHQPISSFTDGSNRAAVCATFYDQARRGLLGEFDWPFAKQFLFLAQTGNLPPSRWGFEYARPPCVKVRSLDVPCPAGYQAGWGGSPITSGSASYIDFGGSAQAPGGGANQGVAQPYIGSDPSPTVIPFDTGSVIVNAAMAALFPTATLNGSFPVIWTNVNQASAYVTADITDPLQWEPGFVTTFSWHFAMEICADLTGSAQLQAAMKAARDDAMTRAMNSEGNEGTMIASWNAEWIDARNGGGGFTDYSAPSPNAPLDSFILDTDRLA